MKSKANALKLEEQEEIDYELRALLDLIKKQNELDKKLRALLLVTAGE